MAKFPLPGRRKPAHKVFTLHELGLGAGHGWDDELEFNTQGSSQWDSLVHYHHQPTGMAYNGIKCTKELLSVDSTAENTMPTLDHWHARGGLVGRGVLIDYVAYAEAKGIPFHPLDGKRITVEEIEEIAKFQGVEFHYGDIFLINVGFTSFVDAPTPEGMAKAANVQLSGVHGTEETAKWFWNKHFTAVASDSTAFEAYPPLKPDGSIAGTEDLGKQAALFSSDTHVES
jgi:hypothetical protein